MTARDWTLNRQGHKMDALPIELLCQSKINCLWPMYSFNQVKALHNIAPTKKVQVLSVQIQSNLNGSNIFETMEIHSRHV